MPSTSFSIRSALQVAFIACQALARAEQDTGTSLSRPTGGHEHDQYVAFGQSYAGSYGASISHVQPALVPPSQVSVSLRPTPASSGLDLRVVDSVFAQLLRVGTSKNMAFEGLSLHACRSATLPQRRQAIEQGVKIAQGVSTAQGLTITDVGSGKFLQLEMQVEAIIANTGHRRIHVQIIEPNLDPDAFSKFQEKLLRIQLRTGAAVSVKTFRDGREYQAGYRKADFTTLIDLDVHTSQDEVQTLVELGAGSKFVLLRGALATHEGIVSS